MLIFDSRSVGDLKLYGMNVVHGMHKPLSHRKIERFDVGKGELLKLMVEFFGHIPHVFSSETHFQVAKDGTEQGGGRLWSTHTKETRRRKQQRNTTPFVKQIFFCFRRPPIQHKSKSKNTKTKREQTPCHTHMQTSEALSVSLSTRSSHTHPNIIILKQCWNAVLCCAVMVVMVGCVSWINSSQVKKTNLALSLSLSHTHTHTHTTQRICWAFPSRDRRWCHSGPSEVCPLGSPFLFLLVPQDSVLSRLNGSFFSPCGEEGRCIKTRVSQLTWYRCEIRINCDRKRVI